MSYALVLALLLPSAAATAAGLHVSGAHGGHSDHEVAIALESLAHGHEHQASVPAHDHSPLPRDATPSLVAPSCVALSLFDAPPLRTRNPAPPLPRARGSGDDLLLRLSCVLLL